MVAVASVACGWAGPAAGAAAPPVVVLKPDPGLTIAKPDYVLAASVNPSLRATRIEFLRSRVCCRDERVIGFARGTPIGWTLTWHTATVPAGTWVIRAKAHTASGTVVASQPVAITIDHPPVIVQKAHRLSVGHWIADVAALAGVGVLALYIARRRAGRRPNREAAATPTAKG
jgi:hypothetical protein